MVLTIYVVLYALVALISSGIGLTVWRRREAPGALPLALMMLAISEWAITGAVEMASTTIEGKIFWLKLEYLGLLSAPVLFLSFAIEFNRLKKWLSPGRIIPWLIVPTITFLLAATNEWHNLMWTDFSISPSGGNLLAYEHGTGFFLGVIAYNFLLALIATWLLVQASLRMSPAYRGQTSLLLAATITPWIGSLLYLSNWTPLKGLDFTLISMVVMGGLFAVNLQRFGLFELIPFARDLLIEILPDGVLVLDARNRVVDANPGAATLVGMTADKVVGREIHAILPSWSDLEPQCINGKKTTIVLQPPFGETTVELGTSQLTDAGGTVRGRLIQLRDISERVLAEDELRRTNFLLQEQLSEIQTLQASLQEQVIRDPLTGLYNRRYLTETLDRELARAGRAMELVSVAMLDMDKLKEINDTYGHKAGDEMLQLLGDLLRRQTRRGDIACRFGGDEFVVIMPAAPLVAATFRADQWRTTFGLMTLDFLGQTIRTTFSGGVAVFPEHGTSGDAVLQAADQALYKAKAAGRNKVSGG